MMDNIDHVSRAYADLEKQDKRIKQLEAEKEKLRDGIVEFNSNVLEKGQKLTYHNKIVMWAVRIEDHRKLLSALEE